MSNVTEQWPPRDRRILSTIGLTALVAGCTAVVASQVEMVARTEGDMSFWGFAIIMSLMVGAFAGGLAAVTAVIVWGVLRRPAVSAGMRAAITAIALVAVLGAAAVTGWWPTAFATAVTSAVVAAIGIRRAG